MLRSTILLIICFYILGSGAYSQSNDTVDVNELALKLSNPTEAIGTINFFPDIIKHTGDLPTADDQTSFAIGFQPALPVPDLIFGQNLFFRPLIPFLVNPPVYNADNMEFESAGFNIGNISYDLALGKTTASGLLYFFGVAGSIPTATSGRLRAPWTLGPELAIGFMKPKVVAGTLVGQRWDLEGKGVSLLAGQYFYAFPLGGGHVIGAGPTYSYDWNSKQLTLPLGTGYSKTVLFKKIGFKYGAQFWYYVAQPDQFGPKWAIRLQLSPVVPLPW